MKKFLKIFFSILLFLIIVGIIFYMTDTIKVQNGEEPIFTFYHKIADGINYSAKVDTGLGYKIIRFDISGEKVLKIGTLFMDENPPYIEENVLKDVINISGEANLKSGEVSGEEIEVKITTFGENYKDIIMLEGMEEEVNVKIINSKLGYSMNYYYDLFEYAGFEDHDIYIWHLSSGDDKSTLTVYDVSNEEAYEEALEKIEDEDDLFTEVSGEQLVNNSKLYYRAFKQNEIGMINYIYLMTVDNLKLMVDLYYKQEAEEGLGVYMHSMVNTISSTK